LSEVHIILFVPVEHAWSYTTTCMTFRKCTRIGDFCGQARHQAAS